MGVKMNKIIKMGSMECFCAFDGGSLVKECDYCFVSGKIAKIIQVDIDNDILSKLGADENCNIEEDWAKTGELSDVLIKTAKVKWLPVSEKELEGYTAYDPFNSDSEQKMTYPQEPLNEELCDGSEDFWLPVKSEKYNEEE